MGGPGSRSYSDEASNAGRKPKSAVSVVGTGNPEMPDDLTAETQKEWYRIVGLTQGVTFSQDADVILEAAELIVEQRQMRKLMRSNLHDADAYEKLLRTSLAVGRALLIALGKIGLTPRDRQSLLIPRKEEAKQKTRLEQIRERRAGQ